MILVEGIVYIRMKKYTHASVNQSVKLQDVAFISTSSLLEEGLEHTPIYQISKKDNHIVVIDSFLVIKHLNKLYPKLEFQLIGPSETIIHVKQPEKKPSIILVSFVWILLFIGTGMTIMNFHYDVSMQEVHQKLHYLFTGKQNDYPLWIQVPYSFGLGLGMILFFNHWFKKKFNEEPSPLEVELFNYQQNIKDYLSHYENELNDKDYFT